VGAQEGGVEVDRHPLGGETEPPDVLARPLARRAQAVEELWVSGDPLNRPVGGGVRGHRAEQRRLLADRAEVCERLAAVGEHHREVAEDAAGIVAAAALAHRRQLPRERPREATLIGDLAEQGGPRVRDQALSVRRDFYGE
jgi:hypothetical protein